MAESKEQVITDKVGIADESIEAVVLEGSKVRIYLKSGSVIENILLDDIHAQVRFESCLAALKLGEGYKNVTEIDDIEEYLKEMAKVSESSSSEDKK